jgi:hypothetical protein
MPERSTVAIARRVVPIVTILIILCFLAVTGADADLWGHLRFGRDIVSSGVIRQTDAYSFTSDVPWVNHEWLAEVIMWMAYAAGGSAGLVALKLLIVSMCGALLLETWRPLRWNPAWRDTLLFVTALGAWPLLVTIRPQMFSLLMFAVLLFALLQVHAGRRKWLVAIPVCLGLWVNLHGGWLVGAGTLAAFVATRSLASSESHWGRIALGATLIAAGAATLCNPYRSEMLTFLWDTVGPNRTDIIEWEPVTRLPIIAFILWLVPTAVAAAAVRYRARPIPLPWLTIVALLAVGSFRVIRLVGFYSLATAFLLTPFLPLAAASGWRRVESTRRLTFAAAAFVAIAAAVASFGRHISMAAPYLPEQEASAYVTSHRLEGRMFTWFDYGEYAIWHFSPAIRVSMDGRRETVYSKRIRDVHFDIYRNTPGAVNALASLKPDYVWLPITAPVLPALEAAGWQRGFSGPRSVILYRSGLPGAPTAVVPSSSPQPRWFPGP